MGERGLAKAVLWRSAAYKLSIGSAILTSCVSTPILAASGAFALESLTHPNLQAIPELGAGILTVGAAFTGGSALVGASMGVGVFFNRLQTPNDSQLKEDVKLNNRLFWLSAGVTAATAFGTLSGLFTVPALSIGGPLWLALRAEKLTAAHNRNNEARRVLGKEAIGNDFRIGHGFFRLT